MLDLGRSLVFSIWLKIYFFLVLKYEKKNVIIVFGNF